MSKLIFKYGSMLLALIMGGMLLFGTQTKVKTPLGCIFAFVAMLLGALNLLLDPFHSEDLVVYLTAFLCLAAVIWICVDLLLLHNRECSNPLPQFESHQGGEWNA